MIVVIGANGEVGSRLVELLARQDRPVRAFVRDVVKAQTRFGTGVEVVQGDLANEASLRRALADASGVFLCSPVMPEQTALQNRVIDLAGALGSPYVVKLSGIATHPGSAVDSGAWHAETEAHLAASGLPFTCLHPNFFMQNLATHVAQAKAHGVIRSASPDAKIAMVDTRDIAEVAARLLVAPATAKGQTLSLTTARAISFTDLAASLTKHLGRTIRLEELTPKAFEDMLRATGMPAWRVALLQQFNQAFLDGLGAAVSTAVPEILGRPAYTVEDYLEAL